LCILLHTCFVFETQGVRFLRFIALAEYLHDFIRFFFFMKCIQLGATLTDQNCIHEEIRSRINSGNAVQNLLSSCRLSRNVKIKIYKTIILPVVLYGCENLSLMLRKEHRLRVSENRMLRRIFLPKRDEVT
jgi:hypothetical protein